MEQAEQNGDVVFGLNHVANRETLDAFLQNVNKGHNDSIQITSYTIEGDPIFFNLDYEGEQIRYQFDNTHDGFGSPMKQLEFCTSISSEKAEKERTTA